MEYEVFVRAFIFQEYLHSMKGQKLITKSLIHVMENEFQTIKHKFRKKKKRAAISQSFILNLRRNPTYSDLKFILRTRFINWQRLD
jgi:hypothetical protein